MCSAKKRPRDAERGQPRLVEKRVAEVAGLGVLQKHINPPDLCGGASSSQ
ncbi:hypothetical protein ODS41_12150 [Pyrobaculum sp. 3827-6]|nr:hypothetical protein [Pyrobaculum sp. 3827-6]MCU7788665.1 hypothetical protein [Pyrobaculum sp. 3827-6]